MRSHEEKTASCHDYLTPQVNATHRNQMVEWYVDFADAFALSKETVGVAVSILDRYLSSGNGNSHEALKSPQAFQRAAVTPFFMAIKIHEPHLLGMQLLRKLCLGPNLRCPGYMGFYEECDIVATESKVLSALEWRVCITSTTPIEYVRHYVELLLPKFVDVSHLILKNAAKRTDIALSDVYFSTLRASSVGIACLAGALCDMRSMSSLDKEAIWKELSNKLDWDINSEEIGQVVKRLHAGSPTCKFRISSRASPPQTSINSAGKQSSSPGSVVQVARSKKTLLISIGICVKVLKEVFLYIPVLLSLHSLQAQLTPMLSEKVYPNSRLGRNDDARGFRHNK